MSEFAINALVMGILLVIALIIFSIARTLFMAVVSVVVCGLLWVSFNTLMPEEAEAVKAGLASVFVEVKDQSNDVAGKADQLTKQAETLKAGAQDLVDKTEAASLALKTGLETAANGSGVVEQVPSESVASKSDEGDND